MFFNQAYAKTSAVRSWCLSQAFVEKLVGLGFLRMPQIYIALIKMYKMQAIDIDKTSCLVQLPAVWPHN